MNLPLDPAAINETAKNYYKKMEFFCSEAVLKAIKDALGTDVPDDIIALASGFPLGIGGSGCSCGALAGGVMALGLVFGRTKPKDKKVLKTLKLTAELHDLFVKRYKSTCCRVLVKGMEPGSEERVTQCMGLTGIVAEEVARIINRELSSQ